MRPVVCRTDSCGRTWHEAAVNGLRSVPRVDTAHALEKAR